MLSQNDEKQENPKNLSSVQRQTSQQEKKRTNYTDINKDSNLKNNTMSQPNTSCKEKSSNNLSKAEANIENENKKNIYEIKLTTDKNKIKIFKVIKREEKSISSTSQSQKNSCSENVKNMMDHKPQVNKDNNQNEDEKVNLPKGEENFPNSDEDSTKPKTKKK